MCVLASNKPYSDDILFLWLVAGQYPPPRGFKSTPGAGNSADAIIASPLLTSALCLDDTTARPYE